MRVSIPRKGISTKHLQIDKAQSRLLAIVIAATVLTVFCLLSSKALISQARYHRRVLDARREAVKQLQTNVNSAQQLVKYYNDVFEGNNPVNLIGGQNTSDPNAQPPNGNNARLVLNALPSKYDFPALITSVAKIMANDGIATPSITGIDDSPNVNTEASAEPKPVPIQLTIGGTTSYAGLQTLINDLERSIRPFDITGLQLNGSNAQLSFSATITTYFQPAKSLDVGSKEVH
jgi:hypothetical protein